MTAQPKAPSPDRSTGDAAGLRAQFDIGSVPVVDEDHVVGMVTDRDLVVRVIAERPDPNEMRLDEILTKAVETVSPHAEHSNTSRCPRVRRT
jgi:CBS domain-containing protein